MAERSVTAIEKSPFAGRPSGVRTAMSSVTLRRRPGSREAEIVAGVEDAGSAGAAAEGLKKLEHALSSEREARAMLSARTKDLGLKWDKAAKAYVEEA